jgi:hypothetical protein
VVPPNQRMQPDAVPASEIDRILNTDFGPTVSAIYHDGAADAPGVGLPLNIAPVIMLHIRYKTIDEQPREQSSTRY